MDLRERKYLVTGASSGIGRAVAILISRLGGRVVINGRNEGRLGETFKMLEGGGHYAMPFDLLDTHGIKAFVKDCINLDGARFDGLVFSSGISSCFPIRAENMDHHNQIFERNYLPYLALLLEFSSKRVLNDGGSIVAISSSATVHLDKGSLSYAVSKVSIEAASSVAAKELCSRRVRVNTVRPEMTETPMAQAFFENTPPELINLYYPLGPLQAQDVANTVVFLLSDMSSKITGQSIYLSAGNDGRPIDFMLQ